MLTLRSYCLARLLNILTIFLNVANVPWIRARSYTSASQRIVFDIDHPGCSNLQSSDGPDG